MLTHCKSYSFTYTQCTHSWQNLPTYRHTATHTLGANRSNSFFQLGSVDRGATMMKGPIAPIVMIWQIVATHWIVFPRPISSARIPFTPFSNRTCKKWKGCLCSSSSIGKGTASLYHLTIDKSTINKNTIGKCKITIFLQSYWFELSLTVVTDNGKI